MRWQAHRGVALGLALFGVGLVGASPVFSQAAPSQEDLAARVEKAREAAQANAVSAEGREWKKRNSFAIDRLMILLVNRCLSDPAGDIPTTFSVYVRLSQAGRAQEILTELDASVGRCMTTAGGELPFPEAPRDDYWIQVNLAAPL